MFESDQTGPSFIHSNTWKWCFPYHQHCTKRRKWYVDIKKSYTMRNTLSNWNIWLTKSVIANWILAEITLPALLSFASQLFQVTSQQYWMTCRIFEWLFCTEFSTFPKVFSACTHNKMLLKSTIYLFIQWVSTGSRTEITVVSVGLTLTWSFDKFYSCQNLLNK